MQALGPWAVLIVAMSAGPNDPAGEVVILDTPSYWRVHVTLRPVLFGMADAADTDEKGRLAHDSRSVGATIPPDGPQTALPPADWMRPEFDDADWWRDPGPFFGGQGGGTYGCSRPHTNRWGVGQPSNLALLCVRGKFQVRDPAQVRSLHLSLEYRGGVVVYLNGHEVARRHLREGPIGPLTLAEDYPIDASVARKDGKIVGLLSSWRVQPTDDIETRVRRIEGLALPVEHLRPGTNVLALEVHRTALPREILNVGASGHRNGPNANSGWFWNTVGLMGVRLTGTGGVTPNVGRPGGVQVFNASVAESVFDVDYGDPAEPLRPMRIVAARNGRFSGQVVIGSDGPVHRLGATVTDLATDPAPSGRRAVIPASRIRIRWPRATIDRETDAKVPVRLGDWATPPRRFEDLEDSPPAEVPVRVLEPRRSRGAEPADAAREALSAGAVQPVWLTVAVPPDADPGIYHGTLTLGAEGVAPVAVPVVLEVYGYRLPDPSRFRTWVDFFQTPETLALTYDVPPWSEGHWRLIEESLAFAAQIGVKTLYLPLIAHTHLANAETLVRWVGDDHGYRCDTRLAERYLDAALKAGLQPEVVCLQVWDYHIGRDPTWKIGTGMYSQTTVNVAQPVVVSRLDPKTGMVDDLTGPRYGEDSAEAFWRPAAEAIGAVLRKRGLERAAALGIAGDYVPPREAVHLWAKLLPDVPWVTMAHGTTTNLYGVPVAYSVTVFGAKFAVDPAVRRTVGWQQTRRVAYFPRYFKADFYPPAFERTFYEKALCGEMCGAGRQSLDHFPVPRERIRWEYPNWGSLRIGLPWLAAGERGPVATVRFENGCEGVQECEARIFIEQALVDESLRAQLGPALADRCQALLDERTRSVIWADEKGENGRRHTSLPGGPLGFDWFANSGWESRAARLYAAAADVAAALGQHRGKEVVSSQ